MRKLLLRLFLVLSVSLIPNSSATTLSLDFAQSGGETGKQRGNPSIKVWVNTQTHVYHCPGTRYGATKKGEYMTQKPALDAGNRPAYGRYCE